MMKLLFITLLISFSSTNDKNENYIKKELTNLSLLVEKGNFEEGFIIIESDTIKTKVLRFQKRKSKNSFLFCITKNEHNSLKVFTAKEIDGYCVGDTFFKKHTSENSHYFIQLKKKGKSTLYERSGIPSDQRFLYFIELPNYDNYFVVSPFEQNITVHTFAGSGDSRSPSPPRDMYSSKNINEKFKIFIRTYLVDCRNVINMVESEYYTVNDIPQIIESYNKCNDK